MTVFDGQFYARRNCAYFTQRHLGDMLRFRDDPHVKQPASAVAAAGGHLALVALLHATAPDRDRRRFQQQWVPLRGYAAATLAMLARVDEVRPQLVAAGAVGALVGMLEESGEAHEFPFAEAPLSATSLLGVLPVDLTSSAHDGPWVKPGGQPLTLAEVAATALAALSGRAGLFRAPLDAAAAPGSGWGEMPLAEYFLTQVGQRLSTFGTSGVRELLARGLPLTELEAAFVAETRDANIAAMEMLTQDYRTARAIVRAGAVAPLVELVRDRDSDAARQCLRVLCVAPDVELMVRESGGQTDSFEEGGADGPMGGG